MEGDPGSCCDGYHHGWYEVSNFVSYGAWKNFTTTVAITTSIVGSLHVN